MVRVNLDTGELLVQENCEQTDEWSFATEFQDADELMVGGGGWIASFYRQSSDYTPGKIF